MSIEKLSDNQKSIIRLGLSSNQVAELHSPNLVIHPTPGGDDWTIRHIPSEDVITKYVSRRSVAVAQCDRLVAAHINLDRDDLNELTLTERNRVITILNSSPAMFISTSSKDYSVFDDGE